MQLSNLTIRKDLSETEKKELLAILAEMQARKLEIPTIDNKDISYSDKWNVDENGFFRRNGTGKPYDPAGEQLNFIESTAIFVALQGGRGCIGAEAKIDRVPVGDLTSPSWVPSIYGKFPATQSFVKGRANLYKVTTQSGLVVSVTDKHRFLTQSGWLPLSSIEKGSLILSGGISHDLPDNEKLLYYQDDCSSGFRLGGELYALAVAASLNILQQLHKTGDGNNAQETPFHLSIVDCLSRTLLQSFLEYYVLQVSGKLRYQNNDNILRFVSETRLFGNDLLHLLRKCPEPGTANSFQGEKYLNHEELLQKYHAEVLEVGQSLSAPYREYFDVQSLSIVGDLKTFRKEFYSLLGDQESDCGLYSTYLESLLFPQVLDQTPCPQIDHSGSSQNRSLQLNHNRVSFYVGAKPLEGYILLQFYKPMLDIYSSHWKYQLKTSLIEFVQRLNRDLLLSDDQSLPDTPFLNNDNNTIAFDKIQDIKFDREGEYYDLTVPFSHNYLANGIFHHNSGKTSAGAQKALRKIREGRTGICVNPDLENFKTSTWPELRSWIPWQMVIPKHRIRRSEAWDVTRPFSIVFLNGAVLYCRGLRDPESGRGHNVNWLWYDEARRDKTGLAWKNAIAGVRVGDTTQRFLTTTPAGRDSWIASLFDRKEIPQEVVDILKELPDATARELVESFHVSLMENRKNLDPIFYATLVSSSPSGYLRQREIEGIAANEEGSLGDRVWFTHNPTTGVSHVLNRAPEWRGRIRYYDLAASAKKVGTDPDETIGSLISYDDKKENYCLEDQVGGHWVWEQILENIRNTALLDGQQVIIYIEKEPASGGKNQVAAIAAALKPLGFTVRPHDPKKDGDRVEAANYWFAEASKGKWFVVKGPWLDKFFGQLDVFPDKSAHDDRITSVTGGRLSIAPIRHWSTIKFAHLGQKTEKKEAGVGSLRKPG